MTRSRAWRSVTLLGFGALAVLGQSDLLDPTVAAHGGDDALIHACVSPAGQMRLVAADGSCRPNEVAVDWSPGGDEGRAAPRCFDNNNRYVDGGNGTVTDTVTGLVWLQDAACLGATDVGGYAGGNQAAAALGDGQCGLTDGSKPGDWRLPTTTEWDETFKRAVELGCITFNAPALPNDAGTACYGDGTTSSFSGVSIFFYWASTSSEVDPTSAGFGDPHLGNTFVFPLSKNSVSLVWPVRK